MKAPVHGWKGRAMTAAEVRQHLDRIAGPGRCPAHPDRSPSLSITKGRDGRTLVKCFAGCKTAAVLKAAGLSWRDLFDGPPLAPAARARIAAEREAEAAEHRQQRAGERALEDRAARLDRIIDSIGGRLARNPENDALAALFHDLCWRRGEALMALAGENESGPMPGAASEDYCG